MRRRRSPTRRTRGSGERDKKEKPGGSTRRIVATSVLLTFILAARQIFTTPDFLEDERLYVEISAPKDNSVNANLEVDGRKPRLFQGNTSTTDNRVDTHEQRRPKLILHVGPSKTGSTSVQCLFESLLLPLERDNFAYIGRGNHACPNTNNAINRKEFRIVTRALVTDYSCHIKLNEYGSNRMHDNADSSSAATTIEIPSCMNDFLAILNRYREADKSLIFSDEAMSNRIARTYEYRPRLPYPFTALKEILKDWDVIFLTLHRPLYDFVPSTYVERYKVGPNKMKLNQWHNQQKDNQGLCIEEGGKPIPMPFDDTFSRGNKINIRSLLQPNQQLSPTPAGQYEILKEIDWKSGLILVDMNMQPQPNTEGSGKSIFLLEVICNALNLTHTCQGYLSQTKKEEQKNPSLPLHYDFIAVEACQRGYKNGTTTSRSDARNLIRKHQEEDLLLKPNDLPLECPNDEVLNRILKVSLEHEKRLRESKWNHEQEETHIRGFWKAANEKKKFCMVNVTRVMEDRHWISFFQDLQK